MKPRYNPFIRNSLALASAIALAAAPSLHAAAITWDSLGADDNWSTFDNWSTDLTPEGNDVTFNTTSGTAAGTTVTNIVDTSYTINSLQFTQSSAANHTTDIADGQTLTVNGSFTPASGQPTAVMFSKPDGNNTATTNFTGLGTFTINNASNHFLVGSQNATQGSRVTVDMSGLANFNATVNIFGVGRVGTTAIARQESGYLTLAQNSTVTATAITVGDSNLINGTGDQGINSGSASTLFLSTGGNRVNNLNADTMVFGRGKATGSMHFASGALATDTVTLRGTNGNANVGSFIIGEKNVQTFGGTGGTVDFGTGRVDAKITDLIVGRMSANTSSNLASTFSTGTNALSDITVTTANLANRTSGSATVGSLTMTGTLNVQGGVFSATTVNLATGANTGNLTRTATLNVDGGTFRFGSFGTPIGGYAINFNSGTVASIDETARTLSLAYKLGKAGGGTTVAFGQASGSIGTIALNGAGTLLGNTTVETVQDTTLGGAIGGAFSLTKTGAAILIVNQNQTYSGGTTITGGTIKMSSNKTLAAGSSMSVGTAGTWLLDGTSQTLGELTGTGLVTSTWNNGGFDTLTVGSGDATSTFDGTITGGNGTSMRGIHLSKTGSGTFTLTGTNSYTGTTTITGGKFCIGSTGTINNTSGVTIGTASSAASAEFNYNSGTALSQSVSFATDSTGGTLSGTGTITPAITVSSGNTLAPGSVGTIGTLSTGTAAIAGTYACDIDAAASDGLTVTGSLDLTGSTLAVNVLATPAAAIYPIATCTTGITGITGTFSGLPEGATLTISGVDYTISYAADAGNQVTLTKVAAPTGFVSWAATPAFGLAPADQDPTDDPENDGINNVMEYVLNGNPSLSDPAILPAIDNNDPTDLIFTFTRREESAADTTQIFQYGTNLTDWDSINITSTPGAEVTLATPADGLQLVTVKVPKSAAASGKLFGRLQVTQP